MLAPVAAQKLVHAEGELATAQAADATETCMVVSTQASVDMETLANTDTAEKWFQLYFQREREHSLQLVKRAEAAGYSALLVTLDTPIQSLSHRAQRAGFVMPDDVVAVNLNGQQPTSQVSLTPDQSIVFQGMMNEAPRWADMDWLLQQTTLPVIAKGVLHPDDAVRLINMGVKGIVVSNHGGRALDGVPATIDALPAIRKALGDDFPLLLDGGIRSGLDVFKAIALGANAVMIGRPQLYALAVAGALGVAHIHSINETAIYRE